MAAPIKRVGLLGGSFNPVHYGHLHLARALMQACRLDEVWFIPAKISPHKLNTSPATVQDRLRMLELAIENEKSFKICDIETKRDGPSYTVDTLITLKSKHPNYHFFLLLGQDSAQKFMTWKEPEEIARLASVVIGSRSCAKQDVPSLIAAGYKAIKLLDVSSTEIRRKIAEHQDCSSLLPPKVYQYIKDHGLFLN